MLVPSLRVLPGQDREAILAARQAEYTQLFECTLEQDPFDGAINLAPLVDVPSQLYETGYNFFSPTQLQVINNCSAYWRECYDGASLAQNFWIVRRHEKHLFAEMDRRWPVPAGPLHALQIQWRHRVFVEVMHWDHSQRRGRLGLPPPRPLDPTTLDIPRCNPDAPPPKPPTAETRAFTASILPPPHDQVDQADASAAASSIPSLSSVASSSSSSNASTSTATTQPYYFDPPSQPRSVDSSSFGSRFARTAPPLSDIESDREVVRHIREQQARRHMEDAQERRRRAQRLAPRVPHPRTLRRPTHLLADTPSPQQPQQPQQPSSEATTRPMNGLENLRTLLHGRLDGAPTAPPGLTPPQSSGVSAPPSTPSADDLHLDILTAALKRALPNAAVTATCRYISDEVSPSAIARENASLTHLEAISEKFRTTLAEIIGEYRDLLRRKESVQLTIWEDERRAMDVEDDAVAEDIRLALGGAPKASPPPAPSRSPSAYWVARPSSSSLSAPPPSLVGPAMPGQALSPSEPPPLLPIPDSTAVSPANSCAGSPTPSEPPYAYSTTLLQYDTACAVHRASRGRKLEFDDYAGDVDDSERRTTPSGSTLDQDVRPSGASDSHVDFSSLPQWEILAVDADMREAYDDDPDLPEVDTEKVISSTFYRDLARDISVDASMDRALVRALETIDAPAEADILRECIDSIMEELDDGPWFK